ncbi:hypothetical protein Ppb6_02679 [Photorhabdus australis subsp. thailandensis]|uniref:Uncharacterized protein n=1 Tax=Photorhabdus australis subsp. thailandensis TaxID=2805096 RepID=A0A1C0U2L3_9GAMM|nr:hypothetical protein [Photorhabdus australis]OCQ52172.1 hypothetical protein Ppb6_02679 [Photorhabdus australis subsp. thailandensis]
MSSQVNFNAIVDEVIEQDRLASLRPVVEKELLHYDILFCLSKDGLLVVVH